MKSDVYLERFRHLQFKNSFGYIACLIFIVIFSYFPAFDNDFVDWDDHQYITQNPLVLQPTSENLGKLTNSIISLNYHPITMASLWLNASISGTNSAFPFIATNVFIHLMNTLLVFFLLSALLPNNKLVAFITSLIFGIHPMHVESVAWVSERKDVLYSFFFILSMICYIKYIDQQKKTNYTFTFLAFILGCGAKAMAVSLVPVLYLLDWYKRRDFKNIGLHLEKIPFVLLALLVGLVAINVQDGGDFYNYLERTSDATALVKNAQFPWYEKLAIACYGIYEYIEKFFFPFHLSALHPYYAPMESWYFLLMPVFGAVFFGSILFFRNKFPTISFGLAFYFLTIALVLQIIPVGSAIIAERYAYLSYVGLGVAFAAPFVEYFSKKLPIANSIIVMIIITFFSLQTRTQVDTWQNTNTLFTKAVEVYPNNPMAREFLATGLWLEGKYDEAIVHLEHAINQLNFHSTDTYGQLGLCWENKGDVERANFYYTKAIELSSKNFASRFNRAVLMLNVEPEQSLKDFQYCKASNNINITNQLPYLIATGYGILGDYEKAIAAFNRALPIVEDPKLVYYNRGISYEKMGEFDKALLDYNKILQYNPNDEPARVRIDLLTELLRKQTKT